MKLKHILIFICLSYAIVACQKQPVAKFSTDKETYTAGDTVHLTDASQDANSWKWTTPTGVFTTQNLNYVIDSNSCEKTVTFQLEVASKNDSKKDVVSKTVSLNQKIFASDKYDDTNPNYPLSKSIFKNGIYWIVSLNHYFINTSNVKAYVKIYLLDIAPGLYTVQSDTLPLTQGRAYIAYYNFYGEAPWYGHLYSGQLNITNTNSGQLRFVYSSGNNFGDITLCP